MLCPDRPRVPVLWCPVTGGDVQRPVAAEEQHSSCVVVAVGRNAVVEVGIGRSALACGQRSTVRRERIPDVLNGAVPSEGRDAAVFDGDGEPPVGIGGESIDAHDARAVGVGGRRQPGRIERVQHVDEGLFGKLRMHTSVRLKKSSGSRVHWSSDACSATRTRPAFSAMSIRIGDRSVPGRNAMAVAWSRPERTVS